MSLLLSVMLIPQYFALQSQHDYSYLHSLLFSLLFGLPSRIMKVQSNRKPTARLSPSEKLKRSLSVAGSLTTPKKVERLLSFTNAQRTQTRQTSEVCLLQSPLLFSSSISALDLTSTTGLLTSDQFTTAEQCSYRNTGASYR
jgi:hypothetical protein